MLDHNALMPLEAEILLQGIDRALPLFGRQMLVGAWVDIRLVHEILVAAAALGDILHLFERPLEVPGEHIPDFAEFGFLIGVVAQEMLGPEFRVLSRFAFDDQSSLPRKRRR